MAKITTKYAFLQLNVKFRPIPAHFHEKVMTSRMLPRHPFSDKLETTEQE